MRILIKTSVLMRAKRSIEHRTQETRKQIVELLIQNYKNEVELFCLKENIPIYLK
jgi:hypothetical protein